MASGRRLWKPQTLSAQGLAEAASQTPGRIQKVDPLMGVPIKYPAPNEGIYFLDPPGGLGFNLLTAQPHGFLDRGILDRKFRRRLAVITARRIP